MSGEGRTGAPARALCVEPVDDAGALALRAAAVLEAAARGALAARGRFVLACSGGRTPWGAFAAFGRARLDWSSVHVVQVDERVAPAGHADRNLEGLRAALPAARLHPMPVEADDLDAAAAAYARTLAEVCGGAPAVLDVAQLGLGADGHTASLVPGDPVCASTAEVALTGVYQGRRRMTLTAAPLGRARLVLWLVAGADKAPAVAALRARDPSIPGSLVAQERALALVERAALGAPARDALAE